MQIYILKSQLLNTENVTLKPIYGFTNSLSFMENWQTRQPLYLKCPEDKLLFLGSDLLKSDLIKMCLIEQFLLRPIFGGILLAAVENLVSSVAFQKLFAVQTVTSLHCSL